MYHINTIDSHYNQNDSLDTTAYQDQWARDTLDGRYEPEEHTRGVSQIVQGRPLGQLESQVEGSRKACYNNINIRDNNHDEYDALYTKRKKSSRLLTPSFRQEALVRIIKNWDKDEMVSKPSFNI